MNIQSQIKELYFNNLEKLLEDMLKHHNLKIDDIKLANIQHIISQPLNKEFYILFNKICYEFIHEWDDNKLTLKLIPNQEFLQCKI